MAELFSPASPFAAGERSEDYPLLNEQEQRRSWILLGVLIAFLLMAFADSLYATYLIWKGPQYSYGFVVPIIAAALIWSRREGFREVPGWHRWVGVGLVVLGMLMRVLGGLMTVIFLTNWAFVPCLMGAFIMVGGLPTLRWAGPAILFLILMYPFPRVVEERLMHPMQRMAAVCSTYALTTMGIEAVREQNTIFLGEKGEPMNVAEACSGLRMLTVFTAMAVALALFLTDRPWWERSLIVVSAIPIALIVNVIRITLTGVLFEMLHLKNINTGWIHTFAHDFAGAVMMPMALGLLFLEYQILKRLIVDVSDEAGPVTLT